MASTAKPPDPMPCALAAVLLQESRAHGCQMHDDRPFIVLTETKPSKCHIPAWARYSPLENPVSGVSPAYTRGIRERARTCVQGALIHRGRAEGVGAMPWVPGGGA